MTITYHTDIDQGSEAWLNLRRGVLTASEMKNIISPVKLEPVKNPSHLYELLSQRITKYVEPAYISDDMLRGMEDEIEARNLYHKHYEPVTECGFITNDKWGFTIGYSPDGLTEHNGLIEIKSRRQKFQAETIVTGELPDEYKIQCQTGLLVSERDYLDFISYCGGMPMVTIRVLPDEHMQAKILAASTLFEERLSEMHSKYMHRIEHNGMRLIATERKTDEELVI